MWHGRALKHGRVLEFDCKKANSNERCLAYENLEDLRKKSETKKNNVLNKNGSNESAAMRWARGVRGNLKSAGRIRYEGCEIFSLFPTRTNYNCAEIMLEGETLDRTKTSS